ncbi:MAG: NTP transferase domain-containing protein [Planctomycetota bacterium]
MARTCAIVLAAGEGRRMGADKALLDLDGVTAIERAVRACTDGGAAEIVIVRREGAADLPAAAVPQGVARVVSVPSGGDMAASVRAGLAAASAAAPPPAAYLLYPVDHALVTASTVALVLAQLWRGAARIALPVNDSGAGHPIALRAELAAEVHAATTLRDVVGADPSRVQAIAVEDPWIRRDLDTPDDLAAARDWLADPRVSLLRHMRAHRSRRAYRPDALPEGLVARLVDAARYASTSSFMQAYSVVAVTDPQRRAECARLCADQRHLHEAPVFLAICADLHRLQRACARHGKRLETSTLELFLQATVDAALVGQNLQLAAEAHGLGSCMIGAARNRPVELAEVLGLPPLVYVVFGMVLGFAADDPVPRGRMDLASVLHEEQYRLAAIDASLIAADAAMRDWAGKTNRDHGGYLGRPVSERKGWTERMAALWAVGTSGYSARELLAPLRARGFGLER